MTEEEYNAQLQAATKFIVDSKTESVNYKESAELYKKTNDKTLEIVRLGTCGAIQPDIPLGSFVLSHYSVGFDGLLNWYADREKVTDLDMEAAFMQHMHWPASLPIPYFVHSSQRIIDHLADCTVKGMTIAAPGFYGPQGRVVRQELAMPDMIEDFESFEFGGFKITNFEMEGSAPAGIAAKLGHEAATICCAIAHRYHKAANTNYKPRVAELLVLALDKLSA